VGLLPVYWSLCRCRVSFLHFFFGLLSQKSCLTGTRCVDPEKATAWETASPPIDIPDRFPGFFPPPCPSRQWLGPRSSPQFARMECFPSFAGGSLHQTFVVPCLNPLVSVFILCTHPSFVLFWATAPTGPVSRGFSGASGILYPLAFLICLVKVVEANYLLSPEVRVLHGVS